MSSAKRFLEDFNWPVGSFIIGYHVALLIGLPIYFVNVTPQIGTIVAALVLLFLTEIGIGGAYHRFYSHHCYTLSKTAESMMLFLATLAVQGSALQWSYEHRLHHSFVDTDRDPYSIKKGFWYAHMLWLFEPTKPIDARRVPDLLENKLVMFQHKYAHVLSIVSNIVVCGLIGLALGDLLGAFVLVWWTRLAVSHHLTWFVNSLAHMWGERTYSKEHSAVANYILAFLTVGGGYHNYHHTFASDYRNGVRWYHFDPTKWTIWSLSKLGLADNLKRFNAYRIKKRLLLEDRKMVLEALRRQAHRRKADLEARVEGLAACIQEKLGRITRLAEEAKTLKRMKAARATRKALRCELKRLRQSIRQDWRDWARLCGTILQPASVAS